MSKKKLLYKRIWLNPQGRAFVELQEYGGPFLYLTISDCNRQVRLEFDGEDELRASITKAKKLQAMVNQLVEKLEGYK